jgi:phosphoribosylformylglycinamidine synthase
MGYGSVGDVRQGKYFEIAIDGDRAQAEQQVQKIAKDVLTNPVIEEFTYRLEE